MRPTREAAAPQGAARSWPVPLGAPGRRRAARPVTGSTAVSSGEHPGLLGGAPRAQGLATAASAPSLESVRLPVRILPGLLSFACCGKRMSVSTFVNTHSEGTSGAGEAQAASKRLNARLPLSQCRAARRRRGRAAPHLPPMCPTLGPLGNRARRTQNWAQEA